MPATITPVNIVTGLRGEHRVYYAQVGQVVVMTNGHDIPRIYNSRTNTSYTMGLGTPAAPTSASAGAGNVVGSVLYRVRWYDEYAGSYGPPGAILTVSASSESLTITRPGSPPSRATHWILERTTNGGSVYFPINKDSTTTLGSPISSTTCSDNLADVTIRSRTAITEDQNTPLRAYRFCFSNMGRVFMGGGVVHKPTCTLTASNTAVSSSDGGFLSTLVDMDLAGDNDTDGKSYKVQSVTNANNLVLATAYAGSTGSQVVSISGARDFGAWSAPNQVESYGTAEVGVLSNEVRIGDDGAPLTGGVGLGESGVLWAKESGLFYHPYTLNPQAILGDGRLIKLPTRRGAVTHHALKFVNGRVYGIDHMGIWSSSPGGMPQEMGGPITGDWKSNSLNFKQSDNWHIGFDETSSTLFFFVSTGTDTYPKQAYVYDLPSEKWVGTVEFPLGVTCTAELWDSSGNKRMVYYQESNSGVGSYLYMHGIGTGLGINYTSSSPLVASPTSSTSNTATFTGASFDTIVGFSGVHAKKATTAGVTETKIISSNTSNSITVSANWDANPDTTDTITIGGIEALYRSPRLFAGFPDRKKKWISLHIWAKYKQTCTPFKVRSYFDGQATANSDYQSTVDEDGILITEDSSEIEADLTIFQHRYEIPLNETWANDFMFEIYSDAPGVPWEVYDIKVLYEVDTSIRPTK